MADEAPWLVVGLGNPGAQYAKNRHNVGFMAVERLVEAREPMPSWREKFHAHVSGCRVGGRRCVVLKPQTYMNRSGGSVQPAAKFHKVPPAQVVVVHDELDFPFGRLAVKDGGGHGGHNGLRDLVQRLGTRDFVRVRVGIGRPARGDVADWVLSDFGPEDAAELPDVIDRARRAVEAVVTDGVVPAMNQFNPPPNDRPRKEKKGPAPHAQGGAD